MKIRKFNGEDDSYVEGTASSLADDVNDQFREDQTARMMRLAREESGDGPVAPAVTPVVAVPKPAIVTKEELEKSGLSLRDYMNKQQGLTRRGAPAVDTSNAYDKKQQYQRAQEAAQSPEGKAKRAAMEKSQALENYSPELEVAGGLGSLGIKAAAKLVKNLMGQGAKKVAKRVDPNFREKELEILKDIPRSLPGSKKLALPAPPKRLGYNQVKAKRGGAVKTYASGGSVSASSRGDGIAQRGKTRGKMC